MDSLLRYHSELDEFLQISGVNDTVSTRLYTDLINTQRALALTNQYNQKTRTISSQIIQDLGCVEMECVDASSCCGNLIPIDCKILRSKKEIPKVIEFYNSDAITRVGPIKITSKPFSYIPLKRVPTVGNGRTNKDTIYAFYYNNRIYLYSKNPNYLVIENINVQGVFEDPTEVANFTTCEGKPCWTPEDKYPMMQKTWAYIRPIIENDLRKKYGIPIDDSTDTKDDRATAQTRQ